MSSKIKITALFAAAVLIVSAAGCRQYSGKEESGAHAVFRIILAAAEAQRRYCPKIKR